MNEFTQDLTNNQIYNEQHFLLIKNFIPYNFAMFLKEYARNISSEDVYTEIADDPASKAFFDMSYQLLSENLGIDFIEIDSSFSVYVHDDYSLPGSSNKLQHTAIISLGGEYEYLWPIWVKTKEKDSQPIPLSLYPGDMLIYNAKELNSWRDNFLGDKYFQLNMNFICEDEQSIGIEEQSSKEIL